MVARGPLLIVTGVVGVAAVIGLTVAAFHPGTPVQQKLPLSTVATVALPGRNNRFDYADIDAASHRLFLAHMDDGTLLELDTRTNKVTATISGLPTVTGVIVVPALHRVFASAAGAGQVAMINEDTAAILTRTPAGQFPDGLAYVPTTGQVWVSDESGGAETVLDARTGQRIATVPLGGEAGNVRYDPNTDHVLVDIQTTNQIAVLDPHTRTVLRRAPVPGCQHDHGLLITDRRAFVACDGNNKLISLALPTLTRLGTHNLGAGPDVLAVDPRHHLLYIAAESGDVTTIDIRTPGGTTTGRAHLANNAHVVAVDPTTSRAYFPVPDTGNGHPGLTVTTPRQRSNP